MEIIAHKPASVGKSTAPLRLEVIRPKGQPLPLRYCQECGHPYYPARQDQTFCAAACRREHHRRREARSAQLYDFAMAWRAKRGRGGFAEMCQIIDGFRAEDRARKADHDALRALFAEQQPTPSAGG